MSTAAVVARPAETVPLRRLIAFIAMVFGMFMAILDIQIVSASLSEIKAGLSASTDEISWVQTSYLIAEVIMIPLSGFLSRMLSTRWMFVMSAAGFTAMSLMCAMSSSINEMIVWRALQGFLGGGMIPSVFSAAYTIFPRSKQHIISPVIGLVATLAPTIGPTIGGYLTDLFSWHWLFLVNIGPGIAVTIMTFFLIDFDQPHLELFNRFDWWGFLSMAGFLGSLEYVLEEGPTNDWFDDRAVAVLAVVAFVSGCVFFLRALTRKDPIVDLYAFENRNFAAGCAFSFVMGIGLYGLTYLYPLYLAMVRGYSPLMIGETMFVSGLSMFAMAPVAGRLAKAFGPRVLMFAGTLGFATGTWMLTHITKDWDFWELALPQVFRGVSLMICMVPVNNIALGTLPVDRLKNASGLYNLTRNLGGAVGLATINTIFTSRTDLHFERLRENVAWGRGAVDETLAMLMQRHADLAPDDARVAALSELAAMVRREAQVMAFADVFLVLTVLFVAMAFAVPLVKPSRSSGGGGGH
ncbi:MAG: DHA2 family efflux MFS transporter permease subunit [Hyphomicrobiales bacterium]